MVMMNLFSVFDPVSYFMLPLKWVIMVGIFMLMFVNYYLINNRIMGCWEMFVSVMGKMFKEIGFPYGIGLVFMVVSVFMYLMMSNLMGLFPFVFTATAFPNVTLGMSILFWLSFFMMGWFKNFSNSCAHLVPEGSPIMLAPLMVLIESVSHLIRPITLAIRLAANMMAGHLIIGLLSSISLVSVGGFMMSIAFQSLLLVLELCVAVIQGFVFSVLLLLYALEYY